MRNLELLLPLDEGVASALARQRVDHLRGLSSVDEATAVRLGRSFGSLAAIYGATESQLAAVVGPVAAARIRWFLDAPLDTGLLASPARGAGTAAVRAA